MSISISSGDSGKSSPGSTRIVGLVFVLAGLLVCFIGYSRISLAMASDSWPKAEGKVMESKVRLGSRSSNQKQKVFPDVSYSYEVDGKTYSADRISFANLGTDSEFQVKRILGEFPVGKKVVVYYQPADPKEAVLKPGLWFSGLLVPFMGALFAIGGLLILIVSFRRPHPAVASAA